jgi:hypothetical protein
MNTYKTLKSASIFNFKDFYFKFDFMGDDKLSLLVYTLNENKDEISSMDIDMSVKDNKIIIEDFTFYLSIDKEKSLLIEDSFIDIFDEHEFCNQDGLFSALHKFAHDNIHNIPSFKQ